MHIHRTSVVVLLLVNSMAAASVTEFEDFGVWQSAVGPYTTIGFNEVPPFALVTTQYTSLGATFVDGLYQTIGPGAFDTYPQDGTGLDGNGPIKLLFSYDVYSIAAHFPGHVQYQLFNDDQLVYESSILGLSGINNFGGLVSDRPFNSIAILDPFDDAPFLDNLYFGPPVPVPSALSLLGVALMCGRRRRS